MKNATVVADQEDITDIREFINKGGTGSLRHEETIVTGAGLTPTITHNLSELDVLVHYYDTDDDSQGQVAIDRGASTINACVLQLTKARNAVIVVRI